MGLTVGGIYLDANALIEAVEAGPSQTIVVIGRLRREGRSIRTSELSLAEVLVKPLRDGRLDLPEYYRRPIGKGSLVEAAPVDRDVLVESAQLRAALGGKLPDNIHVATAILTGCETIVSSDKRLPLPADLRRLPTNAIHELLAP